MLLLDPSLLRVDEKALARMDEEVRRLYRLIVFSSAFQGTDLLHRYQEAVQHLREVLSIKSAQQEAQTVEEARIYLAHLKESLELIIGEIGEDRSMESAVDLFRLFRIIEPEAAARHPHNYRQTHVQFGPCHGAAPGAIGGLVEQLFEAMHEVRHPALKAAYLHHELVRIHPFADGNGRTSRMAKNWVLMYELYPPIIIYSGEDHRRYITGLQESFLALEENPHVLPPATERFFRDEVQRIKTSTVFILNRMLKNPEMIFRGGNGDASPGGDPGLGWPELGT